MGKTENIVVIGGGTGLSTLLRGLKEKNVNLTAVVSVADDGGSTGRLREDYEMVAPGDIRNCMNALMPHAEPEMKEFLNHRFTSGELAGHTVGNIMLTAFAEMTDNFDEAVRIMSNMLNISGTVLPVTNEDVHISAVLDDGNVICGEHNIGTFRENGSKILKIQMDKDAKAAPGVVEAILGADGVVIGPGSLYTSIIPNFLVSDVLEAMKKTKAKKIYICNVMTEPGETDDYTACDHLEAIERHSYRGIADFMIVNERYAPFDIKSRYNKENAHTVKIDEDRMDGRTKIIKGDLMLIKGEYIRHNFSRLARAIMTVLQERND